MRNIAAIAVFAAALSLPLCAQAQQREQQVYPAYPNNVAQIEPAAGEKIYSDQSYNYAPMPSGVRRMYPGRELYGNNYGPIPRHPGDYRDAVDRGAWAGGGGTFGGVGGRAFNID